MHFKCGDQNIIPLSTNNQVFFLIETLCVYSEVGTRFLCRRVTKIVSRDSSVGIATRYGLGGLGIESRLGRDFPHLSRPTVRPTEPPI